MIANGIENFNIDNLQFNLVGANSGNLDLTQATNALKLETTEAFAQTAMDQGSQSADMLSAFDDFLAEARAGRDAAAGLQTPTFPTNPNATTPAVGTSDAAPVSGGADEASASSWSVDRENNVINLDNGYRLNLNEANSELLLEKLNDAGEMEKATKIWGDPHLDAGNDGVNDADFWKDSTLALEDGTKITIGTREKEGTNMTFADLLTITKGDQALEVSGLMNGADALSIGDITGGGQALDAATNDGHILVEGQGNDWNLQDGRTIGQETDYLEFAQNEINNEVRFGQAWSPDMETVAGRGADTAAMPDRTIPVGVADKAATKPGQISEELRAFLDSQGINFQDEGDDGALSVDEWDNLIAGMEESRGQGVASNQNLLKLLLQMKEQIAQMLENMSLSNTEVA